jgi:exopolyphosphatase/guanosine-5'-triphosphate,3'-diphosphate pyrophosphatase
VTTERRAGPIAAIDCGSNSTRLIVVGGDGRVIDREMRITRLGEGVDATGVLSPAAVDRTVAVLQAYSDTMNSHDVGARRVVATSAVRDATNADEFLEAATAIVGVRTEILSGEEEGRLSFAGATARLPKRALGTGPVLVVDIGGGSTELVVGRSVAGDSPPVVCSLDLGCVRVTEKFFRHDPPLPQELAEARQIVEKLVAEAMSTLPELAADNLLVGLAGTVSTLSCLEHSITAYDRARVHHSVLERESVERWLHVLASETAAVRLERPGMVRGREDVIVGGALVLAVVMAAFGFSICLVSEDDILDGMAADLLRST